TPQAPVEGRQRSLAAQSSSLQEGPSTHLPSSPQTLPSPQLLAVHGGTTHLLSRQTSPASMLHWVESSHSLVLTGLSTQVPASEQVWPSGQSASLVQPDAALWHRPCTQR